jgi:glycosyltransferase involved in cell wall biosynthesis
VKKALVITYYWPPAGGAGVQRWLKFVKYMRTFGWEPVVYTAENGEMPVVDESLQKDVPPGVTVLRTPIWEPYSIYKKFIGRKKDDRVNAAFLNEGRKTGITEKISVWIRGNFFIPDSRRFWIRPSVNYLSQWLRDNPVDVIISTGPPHSMHLIAAGLKKRFPGTPWVADFRDPWTNIDFYEQLMLTPVADATHRRMERRVLLQADRVVSVGTMMSSQFVSIYKAAGGRTPEKFNVIPNGYDAADASRAEVTKDTKFSIAHVGTLVKDRNPEVLWEVLQQLVSRDNEFAARLEIKLVGKVDVFVKERIAHYGLQKFLRLIPYMPHDEVIVEQQRSHVLLLLVNRTNNAQGILTGKFFEYMASGVPVLGIGPEDGDAAKIIAQTGTGVMCGFDNAERTAKSLLGFFHGNGQERNEVEVRRYSREQLTKNLCEMLDGVIRP